MSVTLAFDCVLALVALARHTLQLDLQTPALY